MNIDKFGRFLTNEENKGFSVTSSGNHDALQKRIENVAYPVREKDAANAEFVTKKTNSCMKFKAGGYFDARDHFIRKVKDPVEADDVVTNGYLKTLIPIKLLDGYSVGNIKVKDVAFPTNSGDAVNLKYITTHCVTHDSGIINGNNSIIKHIKDGIEDSDAATVAYVNKSLKEYDVNIEKTFQKLGVALFHHIHGGGRASTSGITETNYLDWNKIFS